MCQLLVLLCSVSVQLDDTTEGKWCGHHELHRLHDQTAVLRAHALRFAVLKALGDSPRDLTVKFD